MTTCDSCTKPCPRYNEIKNLAEGRMFAMKELAALCKKIDNGTLVEVVRCQECKWHEDEKPCVVWCPRVGAWVYNDWYCADGRRKNTWEPNETDLKAMLDAGHEAFVRVFSQDAKMDGGGE